MKITMLLMKHWELHGITPALKMKNLSLPFCTASNIAEDTEFRIFHLIPPRQPSRTQKQQTFKELESTASKMKVNQDWQSAWPAARTFHPDTVPLPLRQGYKNTKGIHPPKHGNVELLKIPNFLHLTPPVIGKHCEAIKQFCTKWPETLERNEYCDERFPIEIITSDYCYSSPTIREPLSRIVTLRVKLSSLGLNNVAKDKILRLVGDRYNSKTDKITIIADRCPVRKQNLDYVKYLLTALVHISQRVEPWEGEKSEDDMEYYDWDRRKSKKTLTRMYHWPNPPMDINYESIPHAKEYKIAVTDLMNNEEEDYRLIDQYKQSVKNVLNFK